MPKFALPAAMKSGDGAFPKLDPEAKTFFEAIVPKRPGVEVRPMFGHLAAFVHGNMFAGLFGPSVFVRLSEKERGQLISEAGSSIFEPMPGRPMKEYVVLPSGWRANPDQARRWAVRSYEWASKLPTKVKPGTRSPPRKSSR